MINGIVIKPLKVIRDERGQVMHMLRRGDGVFKKFGEVYFSVVNAGVVKGWKKHHKITQLFAVPRGDIRLVIYDDRSQSPTKGEVQEILMGERNYQLVRVPAGVWYAFGAEHGQPAMIANCIDLPHDPTESEAIPLDDPRVPYSWKGKL